MSEETRAAHWAKIEEFNQRIAALEDERDALRLSDEDREFYAERQNPLMREFAKRALNNLTRYEPKDLSLLTGPIAAQFKIRLPFDYHHGDKS